MDWILQSVRVTGFLTKWSNQMLLWWAMDMHNLPSHPIRSVKLLHGWSQSKELGDNFTVWAGGETNTMAHNLQHKKHLISNRKKITPPIPWNCIPKRADTLHFVTLNSIHMHVNVNVGNRKPKLVQIFLLSNVQVYKLCPNMSRVTS